MSSAVPTIQQAREALFSAVVCDALDEVGLREQSPRVSFPVRTSGRVLAGRARTTLWGDVERFDPGDPDPYEAELRAVDACVPDDVFVAAAGGALRSGIWGELLSTAALKRGCVGALVDGATRDVNGIRALDFPVLARGTSPLDSRGRQHVVDADVTVEIGGVLVAAGDLVVADADGVAVVPRAAEADVLARAWKKVHEESRVRDAIAGGMGAREAWRRFGIL